MKKFVGLFLLIFFLISCGKQTKPFSVAIDKQWYSICLDGQASNLNGFIFDVLLEIAKDKKIEINLIEVNWDDIFDGLNNKKYQAILSAIEPYNFNRAKYDFSKNIIKTGNVLITSKQSRYTSLEDMKDSHVGHMRGANSLVMMQKNADIFTEPYDSIAEMLSDITKQKLEGAVVCIIPGYRYTVDLYQNDLRLVYPLINDQAIRLITLKDENEKLLDLFNSGLKKLKKEKVLKSLKVKWGLPSR